MKKIILILMLFLINIPKISGISYSEWININEENKKIELMKKYRFYQEEKEGIYLPWDSINDDYPYIDEEDYYFETSSSEFQEICENNNQDRIERKTIQAYKPLVDTSYLIITPMKGNLIINNIEILHQNENVTYNYLSCNNCNMETLTIYQGGGLRIKMESPKYSISNLQFKINTKDEQDVELRVNFYENSKFSIPIVTKNTMNNISFQVQEEDISYYKNENTYQYSEIILPKNKFYNPEMLVSRCRINRRYNYHYRYKRVYLDGYYQEKEGYIKDETDYQQFFRYQKDDPIIKEKTIYQDKVTYIDKPYYLDKIVYVDKPYYLEKIVYVDKPEIHQELAYQDNLKEQETTIKDKKKQHYKTKVEVLIPLSVVGILAILVLVFLRKMSIK